jgi:hypothetical protein
MPSTLFSRIIQPIANEYETDNLTSLPEPMSVRTNLVGHEPALYETFVRQEIGRPDAGPLAGPLADIWVAGRGTNQTLVTALRFPESTLRGTDLFAESPAICVRFLSRLARECGLLLEAAKVNAVDKANNLFRWTLAPGRRQPAGPVVRPAGRRAPAVGERAAPIPVAGCDPGFRGARRGERGAS